MFSKSTCGAKKVLNFDPKTNVSMAAVVHNDCLAEGTRSSFQLCIRRQDDAEKAQVSTKVLLADYDFPIFHL